MAALRHWTQFWRPESHLSCPLRKYTEQEFLQGAASGSGGWHFASGSGLVIAGTDAYS